tara:strand:- start:500 stop:985 length:486 start_codon:yes stop_codon:yes gene_type:complete
MPQLETYYLNGPDLASSTAIFTDIGMDTCAPDGFYSDENIARELINCVLQPAQNCPEECVPPSFFRVLIEEDPCNTFCQLAANYDIDVEFTTVSGNSYTQIVLGDEIVEPLLPDGQDGFYAVSEFVGNTSSPSTSFKILEMEGQFIVNILECGIGYACDTV